MPTHKPSILEQMQTIPKIPVPVMSVIRDESCTGIAAIAEAARIGLKESPSLDDATSTTTKEKSSPSITGAHDNAVLPKNANTSWDSSNLPNSGKTSTLPVPLPVSSTNLDNPKSLPLDDLELSRQIRWSSAQEEGEPQASLPVMLTLPSELWTHLMIVADGRGESLDDMLSQRIMEFRDLYGLI